MSESFKILTFEREDVEEGIKQSLRGQMVLNVVLYSRTAKSLNRLEKMIKEKYLADVNLIKCNKLNNLNYALNTIKHSIKTICVADQEINSEAVTIIMKNQTVMKCIDNFGLCLYLEDIQSIDKMNFHIKNVLLITSQEDKIMEYISNKIQSSMKLKATQSTSTLNSQDKLVMQQKFFMQKGSLQNLESEKEISEVELNYNNGIPGVGQYNIEKRKQSETHGFGHSPNRSNPAKWSKTNQTYARME